ncbi:MAG: hypothetical protein GX456_15850 [Verrucomicrobia bacterium]|nr:hypothetical protein [Verrucomicrobiota bacterium]
MNATTNTGGPALTVESRARLQQAAERLRQALSEYSKAEHDIERGQQMLAQAETAALQTPISDFSEDAIKRVVELRARPGVLREALHAAERRRAGLRQNLRSELEDALTEFSRALDPIVASIEHEAAESIKPWILDWRVEDWIMQLPRVKALREFQHQSQCRPPVEAPVGAERLLDQIERILAGELPAIFQTIPENRQLRNANDID